MVINRLLPPADFSMKLWHKDYPIKRLDLAEHHAGSGSIAYSPNEDVVDPVIVKSIRPYVLFAPIPDIKLIFNLFEYASYSIPQVFLC